MNNSPTRQPSHNQLGPASQLPLLDVLSPLWTRWRLLSLVFFLTLGVAFCLAPFVDQKYKSEAVIILDRASNDIATFDTPLTSLVIDSEAIASEIEILFSGELATGVVESESLLDTDEFNPTGDTSDVAVRSAVQQFLDQLDVQRKGISRAIVVKFESTDAARAARIVNAIVARYLEHELNRKIEQESIASQRLADDINTLEKRIADSEVRIAEFRQQVGKNATGDESRREKNIVELNAQRIVAQAQSVAADAFLQQASVLAKNPAAFASLSPSDVSPALPKLRNYELELQTELDQLALTYGEKHPQVQQTTKLLNRTRRDIRTEIDNSLQVLEGTREIASLRVTALTAEMQALEQAESSTWSHRAQLLALERERESDIDRLEFYSGRLRELSQSSSIENLKPFARVISSGQISDEAEFPDQSNLLFLLPALVTLACLGLLVVSGLFRRFTLGNLPALPENTSWFGQIPSASVFYRLPWTADVYADRRLLQSVHTLCHSIDTALARTGRVVMLTGLRRGAGVSTLASAVARCYAQSGQSTVLVSLDLRNTTLATEARVLYQNDLLSTETAHRSLNKALKLETCTVPYRLTLQVGADPKHETRAVEGPRDLAIEQLLSSNALDILLQNLSVRFARIVLDLPPVLDAPDSSIVARLVDASLIVTDPTSLSRQVDGLYRGVERLRIKRNAVIGVVLNRMDIDFFDTMCLDYVASDQHHAHATQAINGQTHSSDRSVSGSDNPGFATEMPPAINSGLSLEPETAKESARGMNLSDRTPEHSVPNAPVISANRLRGESWLLRQSARQFTLCVMTVLSRPDSEQSCIADSMDIPLACYMRRTLEGHAEYVLLLGLFDSHQAAQDMLDQLIRESFARTITIFPLSSVQRDILHYRSVISAHGKARLEKVVA